MRVNYHLFSGLYRSRFGGPSPGEWDRFPTLVVDMALNDWALPISIHRGGPMLGKPGVTVRIGPVNIGWSKL